MGVKEQWAEAGRTTVLLPSGFQIRGVLPSPTEIVRRKLVPWQLRKAVNSMGGKQMSALSEDEHSQLVEARRYQAAAFIREMAAPGSDEFEAVEISPEELGNFPPDDLEAVDDLILGIATAEMITARSEVRLGLRDKESLERVESEEAGDTVDGWADFRDERGRAGDSAAGGAVEAEAEPAAGHPESAGGAGRGRRSGAAGASSPRTSRKRAQAKA